MIEYSKNNFKEIFSNAIELLEILEKNSYLAYFVGGCVRDYVMNKSFYDIDITTSAKPEEVKSIFNYTIDTGIKHGTVTVGYKQKYYEVTTFRSESNYIKHRFPEKVEYIGDLSEDLKRRDFTINAMAIDKEGNIIDFHSGLKDIKNNIIRTVNEPNERFNEDALRMLRAFRFSSQLGFLIEEKTFNAIKNNAELIKYISIERIISEFKKLFLGKNNINSFNLLLKSDINKYIPFFERINESNIDFSNFKFYQIIYYFSDKYNISFKEINKLKLSNSEIKKIKIYYSINDNYNKYSLEQLVYKYNIDDLLFIDNLYLYNKSEDIKNINLPINDFNDVDITSQEIINIFSDKPKGPWIKDKIKSIEDAIIHRKIDNKKEQIIEFLLRKDIIDNE